MGNNLIPPDNHVVRHCAGSKVQNERVLPAAFLLRPKNGRKEEYLSVNWLEYFKSTNDDVKIDRIRSTLVRKGIEMRPSARFAQINVKEVTEYIKKECVVDLSIEHKPSNNDPSHSGIWGFYDLSRSKALEVATKISNKVVKLYPAKTT